MNTAAESPHAPGTMFVPASDCYWAVLSRDMIADSPQACAFAFERYLPFPVDELQWSAARLPDGRTLVAGAPRTQVATLRSAVPHPWHLVPDDVPEHLRALEIDASVLGQLSLLSGDLEPLPQRRWRGLLVAVGLAVCGFSAGLLLLQTWNVTSTGETTVRELRQRQHQLAESAAPPDSDTRSLPAGARLLQAYRRLRPGDKQAITTDRLLVLDHLWRIWPDDTAMSVREVRVTSELLTLSGTLNDLERLRTLIPQVSAITAPTGSWQLDPVGMPALRNETVGVTLTWRPLRSTAQP